MLKRMFIYFNSLKSIKYVVFSILFFSFAVSAGHVDPRELKLKSAFLYKISKFVQWPDNSNLKGLNSNKQSFNLCVVEDPEFFQYLSSSTQNLKLKNKNISIRNINNLDDIDSCHLVYFHNTNRDDTKFYLTRLKNKPVLTIGSGSSFIDLGGMIRFVKRKNNISFVINNSLAKKLKLKINAHLLRLSEVK